MNVHQNGLELLDQHNFSANISCTEKQESMSTIAKIYSKKFLKCYELLKSQLFL